MVTIRPAPALPCDEVQWELCRLAVGVTLGERGLAVARHVRSCTVCDAFVDELGSLRKWLSRAPAALAPVTEPHDLRARARAALSRELEARLARDLLALGQGGQARPLDERRFDLDCLRSLRADSRLPDDVFEEAAATVLCDDVERADALGLAARLDPLGLDVALAWLGLLVRTGQDRRAHVVAERILDDVPNV